MSTIPPEQPEQPEQPESRGVRVLPLVLGLVGAVAVVAAAIVIPRALQDPEAQAGTGTRTGVLIEGLQVYDDLSREHTDQSVDYPQSPPVGGAHDPVWLDCGPYDEPVRNENAVHDLEHGSVWIAYRPDLADDEVARLADLLPDNAIMAPYPDLSAPIVLTVWGRQLALEETDDPRIPVFLREFAAGGTAPEAEVTCAGGTPDPAGQPVLEG